MSGSVSWLLQGISHHGAQPLTTGQIADVIRRAYGTPNQKSLFTLSSLPHPLATDPNKILFPLGLSTKPLVATCVFVERISDFHAKDEAKGGKFGAQNPVD